MANRNITEVIDQMLLEIPHSEFSLRQELEMVKANAAFAAPEMMRKYWEQGSIVLQHYLPHPSKLNEWQTKVANIWMNKETENEK